jgi:hypothetical protein
MDEMEAADIRQLVAAVVARKASKKLLYLISETHATQAPKSPSTILRESEANHDQQLENFSV